MLGDMLYLIGTYWPYLLAMLFLGVVVGWWHQDPRAADDATAWLEHGIDET